MALITDAGTPGVSDPGTRLVNQVVQLGIKVVPIPGPSSLLAAVSASGWGAKGFIFLGFLPRRPGKSKRVLQDALGSDRNVVLFESPFRVAGTLKTVFEIDPRAHVTVARELTKIHEEFIRGSVADVLNQVQSRTLKGELIIIIAPADMMPGAKTENEHEN